VSPGRRGRSVISRKYIILAVILHCVESSVKRSNLVDGESTILLAYTGARLRTHVVVDVDVLVVSIQTGQDLHSTPSLIRRIDEEAGHKEVTKCNR